jgi:DNA repair protein RadC
MTPQQISKARAELAHALAKGDYPTFIELAKKELSDRLKTGKVMTNPQTVKDFFRLHLADDFTEGRSSVTIMTLDRDHKIIPFWQENTTHKVIFKDTINAVQLHPREIVREILNQNATDAILSITQPDRDDPELNKYLQMEIDTLKKAAELIGFKILDILVIAKQRTISLAEDKRL